MAKRTSATGQVLLGLLTIEPMSGYDLGQAIRASIGHFWNESYGQIYPQLKRLAASGLATAKTQKQPGKPDRQVYSITRKGRDHLQKWLALAPQPEIPRNELLLKLFFGAQTEPERLIGYVTRMTEQEGALLERFRHIEREEIAPLNYPDKPYWTMAARFGQLELEAHLRWAEETLAALHKLANKSQKAVRRGKRHANS